MFPVLEVRRHWARCGVGTFCVPCLQGMVTLPGWRGVQTQQLTSRYGDTVRRVGTHTPSLVFGLSSSTPRSGELRMQKLKSHPVRTQRLNVIPFKPGVGQYIAIHATLTAGEFFLAYFYPPSPFTCIFSKTSPNFFLCWPAE